MEVGSDLRCRRDNTLRNTPDPSELKRVFLPGSPKVLGRKTLFICLGIHTTISDEAFVENFRAKEAPPSAPLSNTDNSNSTTHEPSSSVLTNQKRSSASKSRNSTLTAQAEEYRRKCMEAIVKLSKVYDKTLE